jgi:hypothetical protein
MCVRPRPSLQKTPQDKQEGEGWAGPDKESSFCLGKIIVFDSSTNIFGLLLLNDMSPCCLYSYMSIEHVEKVKTDPMLLFKK